jgi:hypothetical protein
MTVPDAAATAHPDGIGMPGAVAVAPPGVAALLYLWLRRC